MDLNSSPALSSFEVVFLLIYTGNLHSASATGIVRVCGYTFLKYP